MTVAQASSSLAKGLALLKALGADEAQERGGLSVVGVAALTGREKSRVSRVLRVLADCGFVERDPDARVVAGGDLAPLRPARKRGAHRAVGAAAPRDPRSGLDGAARAVALHRLRRFGSRIDEAGRAIKSVADRLSQRLGAPGAALSDRSAPV
jgi:DNA-binding IclR family transcriptional regulator